MNRRVIDDYLLSVGEQIRWKRARKPLLDELEAHIDDRADHLLRSGSEPKEAQAQAVAEMGDAQTVGLALDRVHRPRPNWVIIGCAAALLLCGMVLMWVLGDRQLYLGRMGLYSAIGIAALVGGYFLDYTILARLPAWPLFALCGVCAVMPMLGITFFSTASQLCHALPLLLLPLVYRVRSGERRDLITLLLGFGACLLAMLLSQLWVFLYLYALAVCGGMLLFAAAKGWLGKRKAITFTATLAPATVVFIFLCVLSRASLEPRINGVINAESDPMVYGWIPLRVRELISTSRFVGRGATGELLESFIAPDEVCSVDHMLAVATHELGYIVLIGVILLVAFIALMLIRGIRRQSCGFGALTALCIALCFGMRTFFYLLCNLGFTLIYSEGLPLFSYCGKLTVLDMLMLGLLLSVFRTESISRDSTISPRFTPAD